MRIAIVAADLFVGGSQRYLTGLANYWDSIGYDVTVIVLRPGDIYYPLNEGIRKISLTYDHKSKIKRPFLSMITLVQLRRILKGIGAEVVLSNLGTTNILTLMASTGLRHKVFIRDAFSHTRRRGRIETFMRNKMYPTATGIIAQNQEIKTHIVKEIGHDNVRVIGNPVRELCRGQNIKREKIVINVGALIKRKGQKYILDLAQNDVNDEWKYVILGEGPLRGELEKEIRKRGLKNKVILQGSVHDVDDWLFRSSIFVLTSSLEGLPNALIEAMRAGLPCVSFDCETGPRDLIVNGKNGYLVDVNNVNQMIDVLRDLKNNEELRIQVGDLARKTTEKFSMEVISSELTYFFGMTEESIKLTSLKYN